MQETLASPPVPCSQGQCTFRLLLMVCPNQDCLALSAIMDVYAYEEDARGMLRILPQPSKTWKVVPDSIARALPDYVPEKIVKEYKEACAVLEVSPNGAATFARRTLQLIVRDFFGVKKNTLADEINAIQEKLDPEIWVAIDEARKTGNIGKNMEKGVNLVVDCDPGEPQLLINLIEYLIDECYVARHVRKQRMEAMRGRTSLSPKPGGS